MYILKNIYHVGQILVKYGERKRLFDEVRRLTNTHTRIYFWKLPVCVREKFHTKLLSFIHSYMSPDFLTFMPIFIV